MTPETAQVLVAFLSFLTLVGGGATALLIRRADQRTAETKEQREQARRDVEIEREAQRRLREDLERKAEAAQVKAEIAERAAELAKMLVLQNTVRQLEIRNNHAEGMAGLAAYHSEVAAGMEANLTVAQQAVVEAKTAADKASEAYKEANSVNVKIASLSGTLAATQDQIASTLDKIPRASTERTRRGDAPSQGETIHGTFIGHTEQEEKS